MSLFTNGTNCRLFKMERTAAWDELSLLGIWNELSLGKNCRFLDFGKNCRFLEFGTNCRPTKVHKPLKYRSEIVFFQIISNFQYRNQTGDLFVLPTNENIRKTLRGSLKVIENSKTNAEIETAEKMKPTKCVRCTERAVLLLSSLVHVSI